MKIALVLLSLLASSYAFAGDGTARVTIRDAYFLMSPPAPVEQSEISFTTDYDRRFDLTRKISFQFHPYLYGTSLKETRQQQVVLDPRSVYLNLEAGSSWLRAGYMTMKWEGTDGLNPMDIASMKDWSDPLLQESRASAGVAVGRSGESYDVEAAYIPYQTLWLLPGVRSAWLPRRFNFPLRTEAVEIRLPDPIEYRFAEPRDLDNARRDNVAARIQLRPSFADLAVAYYEGLADSPALSPILDATPVQAKPKPIFQLLSPATIVPVMYRTRTAAGYLSHTFGSWIFRAASRYDQPIGSDPVLPSWSQYTVAGFERSFDIGTNTLTAILQGAWVRAPESQSLLQVKDVFDKTVLFGLRYPMSETWTWVLSGFKSTVDSSYYGKLEADYRYDDHWHITGAVERLDGPSTSLLGVFGANDRALVSLNGTY